MSHTVQVIIKHRVPAIDSQLTGHTQRLTVIPREGEYIMMEDIYGDTSTHKVMSVTHSFGLHLGGEPHNVFISING